MLTERQLEIVFAVVYEYIRTGEPVGSRTISRKFLKSHSAATIRNEMSDLEELGYFTQPHSSAGRLPTSMAYRVYVNSILHRPAIPPPEIRQWLRQTSSQLKSLDERLDETARFLGHFTHCFSVAAVAALEALKLRKLDLIRLTSEILLILLVLENGTVRHTRVRISPGLKTEEIEVAAEIINTIAAGRPWDSVRDAIVGRLREDIGDKWNEIVPVLESLDNLMDGESLTLSTGGMREAFSTDGEEVTDERKNRIQAISTLIDKKEDLEDLISDYTDSDGLKVTLGDENQRPAMQGCAVLMSTATAGPRKSVVGLVGPLRMNYQNSIAVLEAVLDCLNISSTEKEEPDQ